MLKSIRFKHYSYIVLALLLVIVSVGNIIASLHVAKASAGTVTITSPSAGQEINQETRQITGTSPALKEVAVFDGTEKIGVTTSSAAGTWSIEWVEPRPGQHSLRATVVDGTAYTSKPSSQNSVQAQSLNSAQVSQNYAAGLSGSTGIVFDDSLQKSFVINFHAGTISQINPVSEQLEETIVYNSGSDRAGVNDPSHFSTLCAINPMVRSVCAYTFNQQSHKLYILDNTKIYIINVQSRTVESTLDIGHIDELGPNVDAGYKLYLDPQSNFLYIYYTKDPIGAGIDGGRLWRINLQTKTFESDWTKTSKAVVSSAAGDIFTISSGNHIQALRANADTPEDINIPDGSCDNGVLQLALAKDESYLYAACKDGSNNQKTVVISMADGQVASVLDRDGPFLNIGNLTGEKLLIAKQTDSAIQVLDTTSNTFASDIQPIAGQFQEHSLVIDGTNEKAYFATLDTDTSLNHLYVVDLHNSGILQDFTHPTTDFSGTRAATLTTLGSYAFIPTQGNESVHSISLSNGAHSVFESGMGSPMTTVYSKANHRIFTIPSFISTGYANKIAVADTLSATFEQKITLPGNYSITGAVTNEGGTVLYAMGVDYDENGVGQGMKIFAIDTGTLQITRVYNAVDQYAPGSFGNGFFGLGGIKISGNKLAFASTDTIYLLNLDTDTVTTSPLDGTDQAQGFTVNPMLISRVSFNSDGTKLAVIRDMTHITIRDTTNLNETRLIDSSQTIDPYGQFIATIAFDPANDIVAVTAGPLAQNPYVNASGDSNLKFYDSQTGELKQGLVLRSSSVGQFGCSALSLDMFADSGVAVVNGYCVNATISPDGAESNPVNNQIFVVDLSSHTVLHEKRFGTTVGDFGLSTVGEVAVLSVTQSVIVRADAVTITSPNEGEQVSAGIRKIEGTAPPSVSLNILVDGQNVGVVQSDEYGAWNLDHNFTTQKAYLIKAEYVRPSKQLEYLPLVKTNFVYTDGQPTSMTLEGRVSIFNTSRHKIESDFVLPDGYITSNLEVGTDKTKIYALATKILHFDPQTGSFQATNLRLFTINPTNNQVTSAVDLPDTSDAASGLQSGFNAAFSDDQQRIYISGPDSLRIFSASGTLERSIQLTDNPIDPNTSFRKLVLAEDVNRVFIASTKKVTSVNLDNGVAIKSSLPENATLSSLTYDKTYHQLILALVAPDWRNDDLIVSSVSVPGQNLRWANAIPKTLPLPASAFSPDNQHLFLVGTNSDHGVGTLNFRLSDGTYEAHGTDNVSVGLSNYLADLGGSTGLLVSLVSDVTGTSLNVPFGSVGMYTNLLGVSFQTTENVDPVGIPYESSPFDMYINASNKVALELVGAAQNATRNIVVIGGGTEEKPIITKPTIPITVVPPPVIKPPTTQPVSASQISQTARASRKQLITKAEKKSLRRTPFSLLFSETRHFFTGIPRPLMKALPYVLYTIILALSGYYLYQTQEQLRREDRMRKILTKQKVLTEEKRNFLELTSHYLRTPLTYIRSGAEMAERNGQSPQLAADLSQTVNHLSLFIESLVEEAGTEKNVPEATAIKIKSPLLSRNFLLPALGLTFTIGIFYALASGIAGIKFESTTYLTHLVLTILILRLFYGMIKNHRLVVAERQQMKDTLEAERALDHSRSKLLADAGEQLKTRTDHIAGLSSQITNDETSQRIIQQGVERLQELARAFRLVCKLEVETLVPQMAPVTAQTLATEIIAPFQKELNAKNLKLSVNGFKENIVLTTNKPLAELTLKSLIENAIQASKEGGNLSVNCLSSDGHVAFQVIDHGEGIPKEKIAQLFKPFVKVGPVTTFNREGIGLSLFLDRLIMHSLGGEVEIMSKFEQGTIATLTFNQKPIV